MVLSARDMLRGDGVRSTGSFPSPQVVAGFEAEDILLGLLMLVERIGKGRRVDNAYPRV